MESFNDSFWKFPKRVIETISGRISRTRTYMNVHVPDVATYQLVHYPKLLFHVPSTVYRKPFA